MKMIPRAGSILKRCNQTLRDYIAKLREEHEAEVRYIDNECQNRFWLLKYETFEREW